MEKPTRSSCEVTVNGPQVQPVYQEDDCDSEQTRAQACIFALKDGGAAQSQKHGYARCFFTRQAELNFFGRSGLQAARTAVLRCR